MQTRVSLSRITSIRLDPRRVQQNSDFPSDSEDTDVATPSPTRYTTGENLGKENRAIHNRSPPQLAINGPVPHPRSHQDPALRSIRGDPLPRKTATQTTELQVSKPTATG